MLRSSLFASLSLVLAPLAMPPAPAAPSAEADAVVASLFANPLTAASAVDDYCMTCATRMLLVWPIHKFEWEWVFIGWKCFPVSCHMNDQPGFCEWEHESCSVFGSEWLSEPEGLDRVERVIAEGDAAELRALLLDTPALSVNADRHALQVRNCTGGIVAHFPLPEGLSAVLGS